jgi:multiple sugar transport system substrate-binding protein
VKRTRGPAKVAVIAAASLAVAMLAACAPNEASDSGSGSNSNAEAITVWTADTLPDRVAKTEEIIAKFTAATGVKVDLVGVPEDQFNQVLTSSAAAGDLPDVIGSIRDQRCRHQGFGRKDFLTPFARTDA